jgi:hypothetical protein
MTQVHIVIVDLVLFVNDYSLFDFGKAESIPEND